MNMTKRRADYCDQDDDGSTVLSMNTVDEPHYVSTNSSVILDNKNARVVGTNLPQKIMQKAPFEEPGALSVDKEKDPTYTKTMDAMRMLLTSNLELLPRRWATASFRVLEGRGPSIPAPFEVSVFTVPETGTEIPVTATR